MTKKEDNEAINRLYDMMRANHVFGSDVGSEFALMSEALQIKLIKTIGTTYVERLFAYHDNLMFDGTLAAACGRENTILERIEEPTVEMQLASVQHCGATIQHIMNPNEAVQLAAVKQDAYALKYINAPGFPVMFEAVTRNPQAVLELDISHWLDFEKIALLDKLIEGITARRKPCTMN